MATQTQVSRLCPNCGAVTRARRFCTSCGIDLDMVGAEPATDEAVAAARRGDEGAAGIYRGGLQHRVRIGPLRPTVLTLVLIVLIAMIALLGALAVASRCEDGCSKATQLTKTLERDGISDE